MVLVTHLLIFNRKLSVTARVSFLLQCLFSLMIDQEIEEEEETLTLLVSMHLSSSSHMNL